MDRFNRLFIVSNSLCLYIVLRHSLCIIFTLACLSNSGIPNKVFYVNEGFTAPSFSFFGIFKTREEF